MTAEDILSQYDIAIAETGFQLRDFLLAQLPEIIEEPDASANVIGYSYSQGYKGMICTIIPSKKGIKLGFYKGAALDDPAKLLKGGGKVHKYVEVTVLKSIENQLIQLIKEAVSAYKKRTTI